MVSRNSECELVALIDVKDKSVLGIESYDVPFFSSLEDFLNSDRSRCCKYSFSEWIPF
jgi:hypothetical protein